jgi:hypothetical protein
MYLSRKKFTIFIILCLVATGIAMYMPIEIPFDIQTKALIKPAREWELMRNSAGNITAVLRNHRYGTIESYSYSEFDRGDAVKFELRAGLFDEMRIKKGDTIGYFYSNEVELRLLQQEGALQVLKAELEFHRAGQKPEDIEMARRELELAERELHTQQILTSRSESLVKDSVISQQQYDLDLNALRVREMARSIAEAKLTSLEAGDKPEQINLILRKINVIQDQIQQLKQRLHYFVVTSPMEGRISFLRNFMSHENIIRIFGDDITIGIAPILIQDMEYIDMHSDVILADHQNEAIPKGKIVDINDVVEFLEGYQVRYILIELDSVPDLVLPGSMQAIKIKGRKLNPREYFLKAIKTPV